MNLLGVPTSKGGKEVSGWSGTPLSTSSAWLPYVEVTDIIEQRTDEARLLGASMALPPREGPARWRSILVIPSGAEIALWQPKR